MVTGFEHINLVCSDIEKTLTFYRDLLGLRQVLLKRTPSGGHLAFLDAGGGMLEIVQPTAEIATPARRIPANEAGMRHIALIVDNVDAAYAKLSAAGVEFTERPRDAINTEILQRLAFCVDPDGISIELCQH